MKTDTQCAIHRGYAMQSWRTRTVLMLDTQNTSRRQA